MLLVATAVDVAFIVVAVGVGAAAVVVDVDMPCVCCVRSLCVLCGCLARVVCATCAYSVRVSLGGVCACLACSVRFCADVVRVCVHSCGVRAVCHMYLGVVFSMFMLFLPVCCVCSLCV